MNKRIYLSSPTMHGLEMKYIQEAFDTNWVAPLGQNVDEIVRIIKSLTAREIFRRHPKIKRDMRSNIKGDCYEKEMQIKTGSLHRGARW